MKIFFTIALLSLSAAAWAHEPGHVYTKDPIAYAEKNAPDMIAGESDTGRFSFDGCEQPSRNGSTLRIECAGTAEVLVHDGYPFTKDVSCTFDFTKTCRGKWIVEGDCL